jgi:hypothetical protein
MSHTIDQQFAGTRGACFSLRDDFLTLNEAKSDPGLCSSTRLKSAHWEGQTAVVIQFRLPDKEISVTLRVSPDGKQMFRDMYDKQ